MFLNPADLQDNPETLEEIERASMRLVTQAVFEYRETATEIFQQATELPPNFKDLAQDMGEDITRAALDRLGVSRIEERLIGKIDYKRARYLFHPEYAVRQALFVDSKVEKVSGQATATLQRAQTSMRMRHVRRGQPVDVQGALPPIISIRGVDYLTTTVFVKYNYDEQKGTNQLVSITVAAIPNGMLQAVYNPNAQDTIWRTGRNAPTLGEPFRVRLAFRRLKERANWRVQRIPLPPAPFNWED